MRFYTMVALSCRDVQILPSPQWRGAGGEVLKDFFFILIANVFNIALYLQYIFISFYMTAITIRVEEQLKKDFDSLCDEFGLSNSAAFNLFMKAVVRERRIPFEIKSATEVELENRRRGWGAFLRMREAAMQSYVADSGMDGVNEGSGSVRYGKSKDIRRH